MEEKLMMESQNNYILSQDARIFYNGQDEIRIRKGIWNYVEATLTLAGQRDELKQTFIQIFSELNEGKVVDIESTSDRFSLNAEQRNQIFQVMETLKHQFYLKGA